MVQVWTKLGLTRDDRMPDLGSDQGAKYKASELRARRGLGLFTELFTVRYTVVTIDSAPGYGHFGSPSSSTGPEGGWGGCGGVREPRKFSPAKAEVISNTLTLFPPRGFERALAVHRPPVRRPPCLSPLDPGDEPRRVRTARASCFPVTAISWDRRPPGSSAPIRCSTFL